MLVIAYVIILFLFLVWQLAERRFDYAHVDNICCRNIITRLLGGLATTVHIGYLRSAFFIPLGVLLTF